MFWPREWDEGRIPHAVHEHENQFAPTPELSLAVLLLRRNAFIDWLLMMAALLPLVRRQPNTRSAIEFRMTGASTMARKNLDR